jgi:hypothetical protein
MRKSDLYSGAALIRTGLEQLELAWETASDEWNDDVSRRFCELHLEPLGPEVKLALDAISHMQLLLDQIHRDCES